MISSLGLNSINGLGLLDLDAVLDAPHFVQCFVFRLRPCGLQKVPLRKRFRPVMCVCFLGRLEFRNHLWGDGVLQKSKLVQIATHTYQLEDAIVFHHSLARALAWRSCIWKKTDSMACRTRPFKRLQTVDALKEFSGGL
eukprot:3104653-Amphidinium_carterae.1